jgi:uncharacterized membrane protein YcaP (DUF421 family)
VDVHELVLTAGRAVAVYALMLVVVRALGKRTIGNFSAFDLIVALMLGEVVDEIIYGDVPFVQGTVAIVVLGAMSYGYSWLSYSGHGFDRLLEGTPTVVVRDGAFVPEGLRSERMNEGDVRSELRLFGLEGPERVKEARIETDGQVSVILRPDAEPLRRRDLRRVARHLRRSLQKD